MQHINLMKTTILNSDIEVLRAAIKQFKGEAPHQPPSNSQQEPSAIVGYMESQLNTKLHELEMCSNAGIS